MDRPPFSAKGVPLIDDILEELDEVFSEDFDPSEFETLPANLQPEQYPYRKNFRHLTGMCQKKECFDQPCKHPKHKKLLCETQD